MRRFSSRLMGNSHRTSLRRRWTRFELLDDRRLLAAGDLDTSFSGDGFVVSEFSLSDEGTHGLTRQSVGANAGKIVVTTRAHTQAIGPQFGIARYNPDGTVDGTFAGGGLLILNLGPPGGPGGFPQSIITQPDDKIVVAGGADGAGGGDLAIVRLTPDGAVDASFGNGGFVRTDIVGTSDQIGYYQSLAVQADGKLVVSAYVHNPSNNTSDMAVLRYNSDGSLDGSFGVGGKVLIDFNLGQEGAASIVIQPDQKIVIAGCRGNDLALARLNSDGTMDLSFDTDGRVVTDFGGTELAGDLALSNGKILVGGESTAGASGFGILLAQFNADGSLDTTFAGDGSVIIDTSTSDDYCGSVEVQPDGRILLAGESGNFSRVRDGVLVRLLADGSLDASFGTAGIVLTDLGESDGWNTAQIQSDGKILAAGSTRAREPQTAADIALARYNADGTIDNTFGNSGFVLTDFPAGRTSGEGHGVAIQADGKIVAVGNANAASTYLAGHFAIERYNTDGTLDTSFGVGGQVFTRLSSATDNVSHSFATAVALQTDQKIVAAGYSASGSFGSRNNDFAIARYNPDGSLDTSFGTLGYTITDLGPDAFVRGMAIQPDGRIVVVGYTSGGTGAGLVWALARYNVDGTLDLTFDGDGIRIDNLTANDDYALDVVIDAAQKIVVVGGYNIASPSPARDFAAARYNVDGTRDATFGTNGLAVTDFTSSSDEARSVALDSSQRIVVGGYSGSACALSRYLSDGSLDTSFNGTGKVVGPAGGANDVAIQANGQIVAGGFQLNASRDFVVYRFNEDGALDGTFGTGGAALNDLGGEEEYPGVALQEDGKIVLVGTTTVSNLNKMIVVRYDGAPTNSPPTTDADGPYTVVQGGSITLDASGSSDPDQSNATLTYEWDFDGDSQYDDATGINPTFSAQGFVAPATLTAGLRVTDNGELFDTATAKITVVAAAVQPDPCDPDKTALVVGGTLGNDHIVFHPAELAGQIEVELNGSSLGVFSPTGRIIAYGQAGNDDIQVAGSIGLTAELYGDAGDDRLKGGAGHDLLFGGDGDDLLVGGQGRDLLIGGAGVDRIVGNADDDILIAGVTAFDQDHEALCAIMDEWTSDHDYATRTANLRGTGSGPSFGARKNATYFLTADGPTPTVYDDEAKDTMTGSEGQDWFFANLDTGILDKITDLSASEFAEDLDFILSE